MEIKRIYPRCPVRTAVDLLGGKWRLLIVQVIAEQPARFSDLKRSIPEISEKVLTQELRFLQDNELLIRQEQNGGVVFEYCLTEKGRLAIPVIAAMANFGLHYDKHRACLVEVKTSD